MRCGPDDVYLSHDALVVKGMLRGNEFFPPSRKTLQEIASVGGVDVTVQQGRVPLEIPSSLVIKPSSIRNKIKFNGVEMLPSSPKTGRRCLVMYSMSGYWICRGCGWV